MAVYRGIKGKGGKQVLKQIDGYHNHVDQDNGTVQTEWVTAKASRVKKRNVSLQHYNDNWDKIFKK
jgi:hypothetical protein